jgi:uncharacterized protein (DUF488 family)
VLADVRRFPGSRRLPHFNAEELERLLAPEGIEYVHLPELGGRRRPVADSPNGGWRSEQFQGYADHMASDEFAAGMERLLQLGTDRRLALMCAEAQWWRCHRRLLSDALVVRGIDVLHIDASGGTRRHELTDFVLVEGGRITYPPAQPTLEV